MLNQSITRRSIFKLSARLPSARIVVMGIAATLFFALCALPAVYMLGVSFTGAAGDFSLMNYQRLLLDPRQRELLRTSALLGVGVALLATLLGAPLGLLLARARLRGRDWGRLALIVPLVIPPYALALAWTWLAGAIGLTTEQTYNLSAAIGVLAVNCFPLALLAAEAAARRVDAALEEAALLVAPPRRVFVRITLPLIAPAMAAAALVIFALAISEFGAPGLLRVNVFTTEVFTAFAALYDFGAATALSAPLLIITLLAALAARVTIGERMLAPRRSSRSGLMLVPGAWGATVTALSLLTILICVALPLAPLALEAGSLARIVSSISDAGRAIINSLTLSALGATLATLLALPPAYARARMRSRWRITIDLLLITLFATPGTVVGVGLIGLWNRPGWMSQVYASPMIILIAYLARFAPVATLLLAAYARQIPVSLEEAAAVAGAGWVRSFTRIVLPNLKTGLAAAWVVSFILAFGELGATILVAPPGESTLPARVYTLIANTPTGNIAALALTQVVIAALPLALFALFIQRRRTRDE